jgi:von Willebrand factor type A domain
MKSISRLSFIGFGMFAACQSYDFAYIPPSSLSQTVKNETIQVTKKKPNVMLLVDKSLSMNQGLNGMDNVTPSKLTVLRQAMRTALTDNALKARIGLTFFPKIDDAAPCAPASKVSTALPSADDVSDAELAANAADAISKIDTTPAGGGTPTAASLAFVGSLDALKKVDPQRSNYILLVTDGLPNCNDALRPLACNGAMPQVSAECNSTNPVNSWATTYCDPKSNSTTNQCLDREALIEQVRRLSANGITTIVVGFGTGTAGGAGEDVLNRTASISGFTRSCPKGTDAECGTGNNCDTSRNVCRLQFFQANDAKELSDSLRNIFDTIVKTDVCTYTLPSQPSDPRLIAVIIDGVSTPAGADTWKYESGEVRFQGALCTKAKMPRTTELKVEIRVVERF